MHGLGTRYKRSSAPSSSSLTYSLACHIHSSPHVQKFRYWNIKFGLTFHFIALIGLQDSYGFQHSVLCVGLAQLAPVPSVMISCAVKSSLYLNIAARRTFTALTFKLYSLMLDPEKWQTMWYFPQGKSLLRPALLQLLFHGPFLLEALTNPPSLQCLQG